MPAFEVVTVTLQRLTFGQNLQNALDQLAPGHRAYLLAFVGGRRLGRSAPFGAPNVVNLTAGRMIWAHEVAVDQGQAVAVRAEVWVDHVNEAPELIWSLDFSIDAPWLPGVIDAAHDGTTLRFEVATTGAALNQQQPNVALGPGDGPLNQNVVVLRPKLVVTITDVNGLYQPAVVNPGAVNPGAALPALATHVHGYTSADDRGRIFIDRLPNGNWQRGTQYIDVTARITGLAALQEQQRADLRIRWTVFVPDDPTDDDPTVHRDAGCLLDPDDYDMQGFPRGAAGYDNEGTNARYEQNGHVWEEINPYTLMLGNAAPAVGVNENQAPVRPNNRVYLRPATTSIQLDQQDQQQDAATSAVRVHCPDVGGDRLVVRAEIVTQLDVQALRAQTGIMSLWKRIDVEYRQMVFAVPLYIAKIPQHFEPAFAQLDFTVGAPLVAVDPLDKKDCAMFLQHNFVHRNTAGWFCLIAAMRASIQPGNNPEPLYQGGALLRRAGVDPDVLRDEAAAVKKNPRTGCSQYEYFDLPGDLSLAFRVEFVHVALKVSFDSCDPQLFELEAHTTMRGVVKRLYLLGYDVGALQIEDKKYSEMAQAAIKQFVNDVGLQRAPNEVDPDWNRRRRERIDMEFQARGRYSRAYAALNEQEQQEIDAALGQYNSATRIWICPHDVQNKFTAGEGANSGAFGHAHNLRTFYGPRFRERTEGGAQLNITQNGYGFPAQVGVTVQILMGALQGQSPDGKYEQKPYFAGQTIVFTHHLGYILDADVNPVEPYPNFHPETIIACVHELTHAFGMPHKCAMWSLSLPRNRTCCMNYPPNWMVDAQDRLIPGSARNIGPALCGRHAKEMRRVKLGSNPVLQARGW